MSDRRYSKYETAQRRNGQVDWCPLRTSRSQEYFKRLEDHLERIHNEGYSRQDYHQDKQLQYDSGCKKRKNDSTMLYLKAKMHALEWLSPQETNSNITEENEFQDGND